MLRYLINKKKELFSRTAVWFDLITCLCLLRCVHVVISTRSNQKLDDVSRWLSSGHERIKKDNITGGRLVYIIVFSGLTECRLRHDTRTYYIDDDDNDDDDK